MRMPKSRHNPVADLPLDASLFAPGERVCVAVSGGADSTALLRALLARRDALGIVLSMLHVDHGLRGEASARDAAFVTALAREFGLPCEVVAVDTRQRAADCKESIEEAARNLRYQAFREVLAARKADKMATAHTLDDQAETVLMKLLRGAWTEGLSGIHAILPLENASGGARCVVRPLLGARRNDVDAYLRALGQSWCEDETNRSPMYTRNRIRHELLPILREYNPQIERMLAHIAANARAEEQHWQAELARVLPQILLPGKPVRGGGRSVATRPGAAGMAMELARFQALDPGLRRRVLRAAAEQCGVTLDYDATERLLEMATNPRAQKRLELSGGLRAERSARELRLEPMPQDGTAKNAVSQATCSYDLPVPGTVEAPAFHARFTAEIVDSIGPLPAALVRVWQPGDRVTLRYSRGPKKVKEVLERIGVRGEQRADWPVVVWQGRIVWMRGAELADETGENGPVTGLKCIPRISETAVDPKDIDLPVNFALQRSSGVKS